MLRVWLFAIFTVALLLSPPSRADSLEATRSDKLVEVGHSIQATLHRGYAELVVKRTVFNGGDRHDQATFWLDLPSGAVAVGLRTLGALGGRPHWFAGELLEAELAAQRYQELTGIGGYYPKDPALLSWRDQTRLALQVFPCPPGQNKVVEYTLLMPMEYREGRYHLDLPRLGTETLAATALLVAAEPGDRIWVEDSSVPPPAAIPLEVYADSDIALEARSAPLVEGALAVVPFGQGRTLTSVRLAAAPKLSRRPAGVHTVVLLDASRSMDEADQRAAREAAAAYLEELPDAHVAVAEFDRTVRPWHGAFVSSAKARADLASRPIERRNGSAVEEALAHAGRLLGGSLPGAPRRVLLLTDTRTRSSLGVSMLRQKLGTSGALVHVAVPTSGEPQLERDDEHIWNRFTRPTGGIVWQAVAGKGGPTDVIAIDVFREWVRPLRLHHLRLSGLQTVERAADELDTVAGEDEDISSFTPPDTLDEGQGYAELGIVPSAARVLRVIGELWAERVERVIFPDTREGQRWAALVFGTPLLGELSEPEMMRLAMRGRAVSPVTSYLAIEPGVRPSTEGLDWGEGMGLGGIGLSGQGFGSGGGAMMTLDHEAILRSAVSDAWSGCGGAPGGARVDLETTLAELVDLIAIQPPAGEPANPSRASCFREALWAVDLDGTGWPEFRAWTISV